MEKQITAAIIFQLT